MSHCLGPASTLLIHAARGISQEKPRLGRSARILPRVTAPRWQRLPRSPPQPPVYRLCVTAPVLRLSESIDQSIDIEKLFAPAGAAPSGHRLRRHTRAVLQKEGIRARNASPHLSSLRSYVLRAFNGSHIRSKHESRTAFTAALSSVYRNPLHGTTWLLLRLRMLMMRVPMRTHLTHLIFRPNMHARTQIGRSRHIGPL